MIASLSSLPIHFTFDKALLYTVTKTFRLFSYRLVNERTMQGVFIARDGSAVSLIGPRSLFPKKRQEIDVPFMGKELGFLSLGFDMAEPLEAAPEKVVTEMYT